MPKVGRGMPAARAEELKDRVGLGPQGCLNPTVVMPLILLPPNPPNCHPRACWAVPIGELKVQSRGLQSWA